MDFNEYQKQALVTDSSVGSDTVSSDFFAIALGLMSEAGEVGEKLKKIYWHKKGAWDEEDKKAIAKELGDVLWYVSSLATHTGAKLSDIAEANLAKLQKRQVEGKLHGFGDDR